MIEEIICIVGPTASGKTGLGIELAKKINAEIISADSMQIYRGLDVATAKVTETEAKNIKHHLIDICNVDEKFSVADFKRLCYDKIDEIRSRGKNVIVVGGTGLYINAIVYDMNFETEEVDLEYRNYLYDLASKNSNDYLHNMLKEVDEEAAKSIHKNNVKRVIRALEISKNSSKTKSEYLKDEAQRISNNIIKYKFKVFLIDYPREILYDRINKRVDIMAEEGLVEEAKRVYDMNLDKSFTCMQAIGYKEFFPYFRGEDTIDNCIEKIKQESRRYAKRQITWFKNKLDNVVLIDGQKNLEDKVKDILEVL